jgi:hypothetical protein
MTFRLLISTFVTLTLFFCNHSFALETCTHNPNEPLDVGAPVQLYSVLRGNPVAYDIITMKQLCYLQNNSRVKAYCGARAYKNLPGINFQICETIVRYRLDPSEGRPYPPQFRVIFYGKSIVIPGRGAFPCYDESPKEWGCTDTLRVVSH